MPFAISIFRAKAKNLSCGQHNPSTGRATLAPTHSPLVGEGLCALPQNEGLISCLPLLRGGDHSQNGGGV